MTEALYRYGTEKGGFQDKGCANSPQNRETLKRVLFAPTADSCEFCDYKSLCGIAKEARAKRKYADPRLEGFRQLRTIK